MTESTFEYNGIKFTIILDDVRNHRDVYPKPIKDCLFCAVYFRPSGVLKYGKHLLVSTDLIESELDWRPAVCDMLLEKWSHEPDSGVVKLN